MEQKIKDLKQNIVSYIENHKVSMKPRWHFVLLALLRAITAFVVFISVVYLISFTTLIMREHELFKIFEVSPRSVHGFMLGVPWVLVLLSLALLIVLEVLTRKFEFVYKRPMVYSLFALIALVLGAGLVVYRIDREFRFARFGEKPDMPILGPVHKYYRGEFEDRPYVRGMHKRPLPSEFKREMKYLPE